MIFCQRLLYIFYVTPRRRKFGEKFPNVHYARASHTNPLRDSYPSLLRRRRFFFFVLHFFQVFLAFSLLYFSDLKFKKYNSKFLNIVLKFMNNFLIHNFLINQYIFKLMNMLRIHDHFFEFVNSF